MIFRAHLEARSMSFEFAAPRPMLPARKARLASIMVGLRPSVASSREDEKLARAATSTCQFGSLVDTNLLCVKSLMPIGTLEDTKALPNFWT